jgi:beta-lactamase regulating signal transducer with metallopeptidase domain
VDLSDLTRGVGEGLLAGSVQAAILVPLVWLACRAVPGMPASLQAALWWLVSLRLIVVLLSLPMLALPVLPARIATADPRPAVDTPTLPPAFSVADRTPVYAPLPLSGATPAREPRARSWWLPTLVGLWFVVIALHAVRLARDGRTVRAVVRRAAPLPDERMAEAIHLARAVGLRRIPQIRESYDVQAPQVVGIFRPAVLVPAGARQTLGPEQHAMALCHELVHVRRADLAFGWVPAVAERLFFFHPLARSAAREYITAREAACDVEAIRALGVSPQDYGRLLIRLGVAGSPSAFVAAGASVSMSSFRRRLDMLQHSTVRGRRRGAASWAVLAIVALMIPVEFVAVSATDAGAQAAQVAPPAPPTPPHRSATVEPPPAPPAPAPAVPAPLAAAAAPPVPPVPPAPPAAQSEAPPPAPAPPAPPPTPGRRAAVPPVAPAPPEGRPGAIPAVPPQAPSAPAPSQVPAPTPAPAERRRPAEEPLVLMLDQREKEEVLQALEVLRAETEQRRREGAEAAARIMREPSEELESLRAAAERAQAKLAAADAASLGETLRRSMEQLAQQQKLLVEQQQRLAEEQQRLSSLQRELADRILEMRRVLDRTAAVLEANQAADAKYGVSHVR